MRLRRHRRPSAHTTTASTPSALSASTRPRQLSAGSSSSNSESSTRKPAAVDPEQSLAERQRLAEEAKKRVKAELFLNSEIRHASYDKPPLRPVAPTIPPNVGSVTSEEGSYLARLSAQAEAAESKRKRRERAGDTGEDDDDSTYEGHRHGAHGIVRRMAEKHHRKVQKREKQRRIERLRRIAALDPLKEGERERGQAKETTFMALIRKYGKLVQQEVGGSKTGDSDAQDLRQTEEGRIFSSPDEEDLDTTQDTTSSDSSSVDEHSAYLVDTLEIVDPGVSAAGHLSNIGNSLIFPNIPGLYDRRPVIDLPAQEVDPTAASTEAQLQIEEGRPAPSSAHKPTDQDDLHLDAYVHELLTKRQKFKRAMQGVWAFLCTPIGVIAGIYGFLVVFGGAALVLFLVGAIDGGKNKDFWVEVFSQFENGLFTIPGVGLIYWRVRDTIVMARIAHYQHLTWRLRKEQGLPKLIDKHDLPSVAQVRDKKQKQKDTGEKGAPEAIEMQIAPGSERQASHIGAESGDDSSDEEDSPAASIVLTTDQVLSPRQAQTLHQLQARFAESQSWYRPHETFTHHAFSIGFALLITILNDLNSLFQCLLCGYMWGYATHYHDRPAWSTGTFMPCSFLAGIGAAVLIWKGGERSKKKREVEEKLLAAFAKDIDAQVERMRRENEANAQVAAAGMSGVGGADLGTVSEERTAAARAAAQAGGDGQGLDLDQLATEITEKQAQRSL